MLITYEILLFCAEECERQINCKPIDMYTMVRGYCYMADQDKPLTEEHILELARRTEPKHNKDGYRTIPAIFREMGRGVAPQLIQPSLLHLIEMSGRCSPSEFFQSFEEIHPFIDGNGRIGAILYNWLLGTMDDPQKPPHFRMRNLQ